MLKTDYKDDVYKGSRQYAVTKNENGSESLTDVTTYTQLGDTFSAADANSITVAIPRDYDVPAVNTTAFVSDTTYADYPYAAQITMEGASKDDVPNVEFAGVWATNGILSTIAQAFDGYIKIYATSVPTANVTITRVTLRRLNTYTKATDGSIGGITQFDWTIVDTLPDTGVKGMIYMIRNAGSETKNKYDEYMWVGFGYEKLGPYVDLSAYAKTADLSAYAKTADLSAYAKTADLSTYAKKTDLDGYAKTADLAAYAKTADLNAYAKTSDLAAYVKSADLTALTTADIDAINGGE